MDHLELGKLLLGLLTAPSPELLSAVVKRLRVRTELLEKFEAAITRQQKHATCELFKLLYGLRMNYTDIASLTSNDECATIIYALQKAPGLVRYENGVLEYVGCGRKHMCRLVDQWVVRVAITFFVGLLLLSIVLFAQTHGGEAILWFSLLVISSCMLFVLRRKNRDDKRVDRLIESCSRNRLC